MTSPASTTEEVCPTVHPWEVVAYRVGSDIVSERQSYPLNFRQLKEKDTRPNAPFADGYSTRYSEIIQLFCFLDRLIHAIKRNPSTRYLKTSPYKTIASLTLAFAACGGSAAAAPGDHLPRPEDPVVLPTEAETAELIKNRRESELRLLQRDKDGWDDIWVMIQKAHDKDYKFDPNDKTKDTDGDGVSDYEEMLVGRNATRKEPVYTREEWIAKIREERRLAIEREIALMEDAKLRWPERQAKLAETLQPAFQAGKDLADPDFIRHDSKAVRAKLIDRRNKAIADRAKTEAELDAIAAKYGVKRADERGTLVGESEQGPIFMSPQDAIAANSIFADDLWPAGLHTWQNTALSRNLTGAGIGLPSGRRMHLTARLASSPRMVNSTVPEQCKQMAVLPATTEPPWQTSWWVAASSTFSAEQQITEGFCAALLTQVKWMGII